MYRPLPFNHTTTTPERHTDTDWMVQLERQHHGLGGQNHTLRTTHLVFSLGLFVVFIHIDGVVGGVHIHRWVRLLPAASLVYGRSAARAAAPGRGHARGDAVWCRCCVVCECFLCGDSGQQVLPSVDLFVRYIIFRTEADPI